MHRELTSACQGASVAAAFLSSYGSQAQSTAVFAFAVFICAALIPPALASKNDKLEETVGSLVGTAGLPMPTVHIIGTQDQCLGQSVRLLESCQGKASGAESTASSVDSTPSDSSTGLTSYFPPGLAQAVFFQGGHHVPKEVAMISKMQQAVENAARIAFLG